MQPVRYSIKALVRWSNRSSGFISAFIYFTMIGLTLMIQPTLQAASTQCPTWYLDRDNDGYGDPDGLSSRMSCSQPNGFVSNRQDCNDFSARIYPNAPDDFWADVLESSDCNVQQSYEGELLTVGCPVCSPSDPNCTSALPTCSSPLGCAYPRVQDAIDAARDGDTIEICQGIYPERLDFDGKDLQVRGRQAQLVVLAGDGTPNPIVSFTSGESSTAQLSHLVISPNVRGGVGGGILIENASPTLFDLVLQGNTLSSEGGAMVISATGGARSAPTVSRVTFTYNHALDVEYGAGGAVGIVARDAGSRATPSFTDVLFVDNSAIVGGAVHVVATARGYAAPTFERARFLRNTSMELGSALAFEVVGGTGSLNITSAIFEKNVLGGEALYLYAQDGTLPVTITNSTLVGNDAARGVINGVAGPWRAQLTVALTNSIVSYNHATTTLVKLTTVGRDSTAQGSFYYNDVYSNGYLGSPWPQQSTAGTTYTFDPRFRNYVIDDSTPSDLTLQPGSPAINAGDPSPSLNDASNNRNDLGAYGGPDGHWPTAAPVLLNLDSALPDPEGMVLSRAVDIELLSANPSSVSCLERTMSSSPGEHITFTSSALRTTRLDLLGLKSEATYDCFVLATSSTGLAGHVFEFTVPPLPFELLGLWSLGTYTQEARQGYTLFNVFPASFNPMFAVMVDMQGHVRWYLEMFNSSTIGYSPDNFTADTAVQYRADKGEVLFGGGESLDALPQLHPLEPSKPARIYPLACASQQDPIQALCADVPGSTVMPETPHHDTIMSVDGKKVMYLCSETLPQPGTTPEQYCVDPAARMEGFSVEEWDVSVPDVPVNTWRWSSREQVQKCTLPLLAGEEDPFHANGLWREEATDGSVDIFVSLRHRNQVLKIDRATSTLEWKLGGLTEEDKCPAITQADPTQCLGYDPALESDEAALSEGACPAQHFEPFRLDIDTQDTTCPSAVGYAGLEENHPQWFYGQHSPWRVQNADGTATLYLHDNGRDSPDNVEDPTSRGYSRAVRLRIDEVGHAAKVEWQYCRGTEKGSNDVWFAPAWGSYYPIQTADKSITDHSLLATSHCTICSKYDDADSENTLIAELSADKQVVWSLDLGQAYGVYRAQRIDGCTRLPGRTDFLMGTGELCGEPTQPAEGRTQAVRGQHR